MLPFFTLILMLLIAGLVVTAAAIYLMARGLVRPPRMTDGKALHVLNRLTPRDLDLPYENCAFDVRDEQTGGTLRLAAWWMPALAKEDGGSRVEDGQTEKPAAPLTDPSSTLHPPSSKKSSSRTVILIHGYADAKIGAIAWAPLWHELGFNVLALDLRAHGDSAGTLCSGGFHERHDLVAVVHELIARRPQETRTLLLFGASMGAAAAAGAAEILTAPAEQSPVIHGLVLDSPFVTFRSASAAHFERLGLPGGFIARAALRLAERMTSAQFDAINLVNIAATVRCPLLIMAPAPDGYLPAEAVAVLKQTLQERSAGFGGARIEEFPNAGHLMALVTEPARYRQAVQHFLRQIQPSADVPSSD